MSDDALFLLGVAASLIVTFGVMRIVKQIKDAELLDSIGMKPRDKGKDNGKQ